jgi:hypothetical protein
LTKPIKKDSKGAKDTTSAPPPSQEPDNVDEQPPIADTSGLEVLAEPEQPGNEVGVSKPQTKSNEPFYWTTKYFTHSSALLGSILHSLQPKSTLTLEQLQAHNLSQNADQMFAATVPGISRFLDSEHINSVHPQSKESMIMRFIPNPLYTTPQKPKGVGAKALTVFPLIEMRFTIDPETDALSLRDVQSILSTENSDLMLPDSSVDVRFDQRTTSRLRSTKSANPYPASIIQFIADSNLNIRGSQGLSNGKLETPPKLMIPIASHLCREEGFGVLGLEEGEAIHDVEYLFAGLEIKNTMVMEFDGWELHYTSVEAGRANGHRGELRLRPNKLGKRKEASAGKHNEEEFVRSALALVDALDGGKGPRISFSKHATDSPVSWKRSGPRLKFHSGGGKEYVKKLNYFAKRIEFRNEEEVRDVSVTGGGQKEEKVDKWESEWGLDKDKEVGELKKAKERA